ncbi:MAG: protein kinase [Myxococcota bacterium]
MARPHLDDFQRGHRVGKYELVTRLSVGGMAELYLAFLRGPGGFKKFVALKMILPDIRRDEDFIKMFLDEARLMAALDHPNLGQVYELGHEPETGELYLAMEYLAGTTVFDAHHRARAKGEVLPVGFSCRVLRDACLGLHAAHTFVDARGAARPIVHRDVTPGNVMVTWAGRVKVIDFGVARAPGRLARTQVGLVKGTAGYMSPEQATDQPLDARSDVFSAGMVLYELLAGAAPFAGVQGRRLLEAVAARDVPPLARVAPSTPPALADAVMTALERDLARRCPSAKEFARRLEAACPGLFDEERLAAELRVLFPDGVELSRALLESADRGEAQDRELEALATRLREVTAPRAQALPEPPPAAAGAAPRRAADVHEGPSGDTATRGAGSEPPQERRHLLVGLGLALCLVLGVGYALTSMEGEEASAPADEGDTKEMKAMEAQVMPQVHTALAARDLTRARQLIESCQVRGKPCPAAVALLPQVEAEAAKRAAKEESPPTSEAAVAPGACELDAAHAALREVDFERAAGLLRACTTSTGLDPRAEKLLAELGKSSMHKKTLLKARDALEAGNVKEAESQLSLVPKRGVWLEIREALLQRLKRAKAERSAGAGPRGKVLEVGNAAGASAPAAKPTTMEQGFLDSAAGQLARGQVEGAVATLRACVTAQPRSAECEYQLAQALARAGDPGEALRAYRRFLELARPSDARVPRVKQVVADFDAASAR